jgi:parallel beta-helix repeat protein
MNLRKLTVLSALALALAFGTANRKVAAAATLLVDDDLVQCPTATFPSINAAVAVAGAGDTIMVCAGTYNELVQVNKTLTIFGAQSGVDARTRAVPVTSESVVGSGDGAFQILANKVVIDGFTIQGVTNNPSDPPFTGLGAGIWSNPGFNGTNGGHQIRNNIIQNNINGIFLHNDGTFAAKVERNLIKNNNAPGPGSGTGIDSELGSSNMTIDSNKFVGNDGQAIALNPASNVTVSSNEFDSNGRAFFLLDLTSSTIITNNIHNSTGSLTADIRIFGGVSGLTIKCNILANGAGRAIRINDGIGGDPNSSITVNDNNISGYPVAGLEVNSGGYTGGPGSLNAENNWWGSSTGPTNTNNPGGTGEAIVDPDLVVDFVPFRTAPVPDADNDGILDPCDTSVSVGPPTNKDQCKNGGWQTFNTPRKFKNQGDCIQFVNNGK